MIEIKGLNKKFGDHSIFEDFHLKIDDQDFIAIVGKSGCGKTTLLNILGLLDFDYQGEVMYDHIHAKKLGAKKRAQFVREKISYLFQNYALIDDQTVYENLWLALYYRKLKKEEKDKKIQETLKMVGLEEFESKKIYTLSGGEQQRVALARAILKPCQIILADEPTGNLDASNRDIVLANLLKLNQEGKTVIIVTHDDYIAKKCKRVIHL